MSTELGEAGVVPEWTLGDRLTKARKMSGMTVAEFAEQIGVSDRTVNNAENDRRSVRAITLNAWAWATGVSRHWLETGEGVMPNPPSGRQEARGPTDRIEQFAAEKRRRGRGPATRQYAEPIAS